MRYIFRLDSTKVLAACALLDYEVECASHLGNGLETASDHPSYNALDACADSLNELFRALLNSHQRVPGKFIEANAYFVDEADWISNHV
jgi:hypothetical protein